MFYDYRTFKSVFLREFTKKLSADYTVGGFDVVKTFKNNGVSYDNAVFRIREKAGGEITPVPAVYIEPMYDFYMKCGSNMEATLSHALDMFDKGIVRSGYKAPDIIGVLSDKDRILSSVFLRAVNERANRDRLANAPHINKNGMSVEFRILFQKNSAEIGSVLLTNDMFKGLGISMEELYKTAITNSKKLLGVRISPIENIIGYDGNDVTSPQLICVSNEKLIYGAALMFDSGVMDAAAERLGCQEFFVIPSSVHEVLCYTPRNISVGDIAHIVYDINKDMVSADEQLSNDVLMYDSRDKTLTTVISGKPLDIGTNLIDINNERKGHGHGR